MIVFINSTADFWFQNFGLKVIQDTIFLALIFLTLGVLKNISAQSRYMLSLLGLTKLLLPPFLPFQLANTEIAPLLASPSSATTAQPATTAAVEPAFMPTPISPEGIVFTIWFCVMLIYLVVFVIFNIFQKQQLEEAQPVDGASLPHDIKLKQMEKLATPHSFLFSKQIVLPSYWQKLPKDCQHVMLQHEIAHIKRRDGVVQILQTIAQAIYFFHPMVWLLNERINEYREMACDDTAIETSQLSPMAYSRYLVHIAEKMVQPVWPFSSASALIKQKNKLLNRVNYQIKEAKMKRKAVTISIIVLIVMMAPLSWYCSKDKGLNVDKDQPTSTYNVPQFVAYDSPPQPVGGFAAIQSNLEYPARAEQLGLQGRVYLNVLIDSTGTILETRVLKSPGTEKDIEAHPDNRGEIPVPYIDKEAEQDMIAAAEQAVKATEWKPAKQRDKTVSVWVGIPVVFKLNAVEHDVISNFDGTPGPVGGQRVLDNTFGSMRALYEKYKESLPSEPGAPAPFTQAMIHCHIDENGRCFEAEVSTRIEQHAGSASCAESAIPVLKEMPWNVVKKNGQPISYWHTVYIPCETKNDESASVQETEQEAWQRLGIYSKSHYYFQKDVNENEIDLLFECQLDKDGNLITAKLLKSSGDSEYDKEIFSYLKSNQVISMSPDVKEPITRFVGIKKL
jgi:beta-lactamase regulating signal transducer with metallopeptidase domain